MFYKQFLKITDVLNSSFVENFDYWLATLPKNNQKSITASLVSAKFGVKYSFSEFILDFAEKQGILDVRILMNNNTEINIEIQLSYLRVWADRSLFYLAKLYSGQIKPGQNYTVFKK